MKFFAGNKLKKKYLYSYVFIYIIIAAVLSVVVLGYTAFNVSQKNERMYTEYAKMAENRIEENLETVEKFMAQLSQTQWIKRIIYMQGNKIDYNRVSYQSLSEYEGELINFVQSNGFMDDMAIVFNKKDFALSTLGHNSVGDFYDFVFSFEEPSLLNKIEYSSSGINFISKISMQTFGSGRNGMLFYAGLPINSTNHSDTLALVFIDEEKILDMMDSIYAAAGIKYLIADDSGVLYTNALKRGQTEFDGRLEGHTPYMLESSRFGWQYYTFVPTGTVTVSFVHDLLMTLLILLMFWAAGLFLVFRFALKNYRPIDAFINSIKENLEEQKLEGADDFISLEHEIRNLYDKQAMMMKEIERQRPVICNTYLSYLVSGNESIHKLEAYVQLLGIEFRYSNFVCASTQRGRVLIPELENCIIYKVELLEGITLLINFEANLAPIMETVGKMNRNFCFGVGKTVRHSNRIQYSYLDSVRAYSYHDLIGGSIIYYENIQMRDAYIFSDDDKTRLCNCICAAQEYDIIRLIDALAAENEGKCNHEALTTFYLEIQLAALKVLEGFEKIVISPNVHYATKEAVTQFCINVSRFYKEYASKEDVSSKVVLEYVDVHFKDCNLSLATVGAYFGFSASYISKFFKDQYNVNFLEYINKKRIKEAKQLLYDSNMDILMIAKSVGYENDVTFRRLFKKYEGITPSEYREQNH